MSAHTPGPWAVKADGLYVGPKDGFEPFGGCGCCGSPWMNAKSDATQLADANLIAAAPDLLAALKSILDPASNEDGEWYRETRAAARAAIAKAEGAAP